MSTPRFPRKLLWLPACLLALLLFTPTRPAAAHPLGNFTISRYSALTVGQDEILLDYAVDMAEIPTYQHWPELDQDGDGAAGPAERAAFLERQVAALGANLRLRINGRDLSLEPIGRSLELPLGQADLPTLRLTARFAAALPAGEPVWQADYADDNFADRPGWQEVVVRAGAGVELTASSVPSEDLSQALGSYPADLLNSPPAVSRATFTFAPAGPAQATGAAAVPAAVASPTGVLAQTDERFARLIALPALSPAIVATALLAAFGLGALHALAPGHGKTIVGAYLVGARGTARHALFLGLTTTLTHTLGVFAFGLLVLFASRFVLPEQLYPWLSALSGLLLAGIGLSLLGRHLRRLGRDGGRGRRRPYADHAHDQHLHDHPPIRSHDHEAHHHGGPDGHHHDHEHADGHQHHHDLPETVTWRNLLALGISGGLLPCPSALIVLLSAVALGRVGFGLVLIVAFSLGLAGVLTGIGLLVVYAGRVATRVGERLPARLPGRAGVGRLLRVAPAVSALIISLIGVGFIWGALRQIAG